MSTASPANLAVEIPNNIGAPAGPAAENPLAEQARQDILNPELYRQATGTEIRQLLEEEQQAGQLAAMDADDIYSTAAASQTTDPAALSTNEQELNLEYSDIRAVIDKVSALMQTATNANDLALVTTANNTLSNAESAQSKASYSIEDDVTRRVRLADNI